MIQERIRKVYSEAFKRKVVKEIESGKYNVHQAGHVYGVTGGDTIMNWLKKYGTNKIVSKVVRIEMANETDRIKELEKEVKALKLALADEHLARVAFESLVEIAKSDLGIDLKKKFGTERSAVARKSSRRKK